MTLTKEIKYCLCFCLVVVSISVMAGLYYSTKKGERLVGVILDARSELDSHCVHSSTYHIIHFINLHRIVDDNKNWFLEYDWIRLQMFGLLNDTFKIVTIDLADDPYRIFCNNTIIVESAGDTHEENNPRVTKYIQMAQRKGVNIIGE